MSKAIKKTSKKQSKPSKAATVKPRKQTRMRAWKEAFLVHLSIAMNVSAACKAVGRDQSYVYQVRKTDKEFAVKWDEALEIASHKLQEEAFKRAHTGWEEPVFQGGALVGKVRKYSDTLMITLLKAHQPQKYRDNIQHQHSGPEGAPIETTLHIIAKDQGEIFNNISRNGFTVAEAAG